MNRKLQILVDELVEVKTSLKLLQQREREIKHQIEPLIEHGHNISLPDAEIYCADHKTKRYVYRDNLLEYLRKEYGNKIAEDVDLWCTHIRPSTRNVRIKLKDQ